MYQTALAGRSASSPVGLATRLILWVGVVVGIASLPMGNQVASAQDLPKCLGKTPTLIVPPDGVPFFGTPGDDVILGSMRADEIHGGGGNDTICGRLGPDRIFGDEGHDTLHGNWGKDRIEGGEGNDLLHGGRHNDHVLGQAGSDTIRGFKGNDLLEGGASSDRIWGGPHADRLFGQGGDDYLFAGPGQDECSQGPGSGTITDACEKIIAPEPPPPPPVVGSPGCGNNAGRSGAIHRRTFNSEGRTREYRFVLPDTYDKQTPFPVVISFHGYKLDGWQHVGWSKGVSMASIHDLVFIAPTGMPALGSNLNRWELSGNEDPTRDDLTFFDDLLDDIGNAMCLDLKRVYTSGFSNGGWFSARLACERSLKVTATSAVAATTRPEPCNQARRVPHIAFHGTSDKFVSYAGGPETLLLPNEFPYELIAESIPEEMSQFAAMSGCSPSPVVEGVTGEVDRLRFPCSSDIDISLYRHNGGGHTWPGSSVSAAESANQPDVIGATAMSISANDIMWAMFDRYELPES